MDSEKTGGTQPQEKTPSNIEQGMEQADVFDQVVAKLRLLKPAVVEAFLTLAGVLGRRTLDEEQAPTPAPETPAPAPVWTMKTPVQWFLLGGPKDGVVWAVSGRTWSIVFRDGKGKDHEYRADLMRYQEKLYVVGVHQSMSISTARMDPVVRAIDANGLLPVKRGYSPTEGVYWTLDTPEDTGDTDAAHFSS